MGCDIWVHLEKKVDEKYNSWEEIALYRIDKYTHKLEIAPPYEGRNYGLFSLLAGIRGWMDALVEPRGLPENMSREVEKAWKYSEDWCHTPTWYVLNELYLYRRLYKDFKGDEDDKEAYDSFVYFVDCIENYLELTQEWTYGDARPNEYRLIIWFDS